MSHHLCTIYGVKRAKSVTSLEFINFSKVIFTIIFSYLLLNHYPRTTEINIFDKTFNFPNQIIGAIIIAITLLFFTRRVNSEKNNNLDNNNLDNNNNTETDNNNLEENKNIS